MHTAYTKIIFEKKERTKREKQKDMLLLMKYQMEYIIKKESYLKTQIDRLGFENLFSIGNISNLDAIEQGLKNISTYSMHIDEYLKTTEKNLVTYVANITNIDSSRDSEKILEKGKSNLESTAKYFRVEIYMIREILTFIKEQILQNNIIGNIDTIEFKDKEAAEKYEKIISQLNSHYEKADQISTEEINLMDEINGYE